jgi:hypothetical protein
MVITRTRDRRYSRMKRDALVLFALLLGMLLICFSAPAQAGVSKHISFSGRLADPDTGKPKPNGVYTMTLRIYGAPTGGTPLFTEVDDVTVEGGLFSVVLGDQQGNALTLDFSDDYWLGVKVGTDPEMPDRIPFKPSPYALFALDIPAGSVTTDKIADGAVTSDKLAPGSLIDFRVEAPDGAVYCSGTSWQDIPGMTITKTTQGGPVMADFVCGAVGGPTGNDTLFRLQIDGITKRSAVHGPEERDQVTILWMETLAAGSHTFKVQWRRTLDGGSVTEGDHRFLRVVEFKR